jgi:para-aminobenzoate synthetase / 4-amino-4-deoxychorismate lyase
MTLPLRPPFVLLEDRLTPGRPARIFQDPVEIIRCDEPADVIGALRRVERSAQSGLHAAGFVGYEAGNALEPRLAPLQRRCDTPLVWFGLFEDFQEVAPEVLDDSLAALGPPPPLQDVRAGHTEAEHAAKVEQILAYIRAGDIYQANLTFPIAFRYGGPVLALYAAVRARQPVAHGAVVATGEHLILSVSPELFIAQAGEVLTTRPMKGTCVRSADPALDAAAAQALAADPKQRAENLMIVDLLRNDLSRICAPGSVRTEALFSIETYPTLHTLTSTVTGRTQPGLGLAERFQALFPCGSIVGAPKIRAGEIITELERQPRGVYTGAIGWVAPDGDLSFNVAIRTAVIGADGRGSYGVGGGVVADSEPAAEYVEALLKGQLLTELAEDFGLIETLRWRPDVGFLRLTGHLDRLERSARRLGFAFERSAVTAAFHRALADREGAGDRRVRAVLSRDGRLSVTATAIEPAPGGMMRVGVAAEPLDAADPFLRHKTTRRAAYDNAFALASADGLDETLLLNRAGRIADASRNSVFLEADGRLVTPPVSAGALPGVLRASLIAEGRAMEGELTVAQLGKGRWFLGNSLHGLRPAVLAADGAAILCKPAA